MILASAGLRLLIREGRPPYIAATLHANVKAVPTSPPVDARRCRTVCSRESAQFSRTAENRILNSLDRFSIAVEYVSGLMSHIASSTYDGVCGHTAYSTFAAAYAYITVDRQGLFA